MFEVVDPSAQRVLYSRGFSSIFGEWITTTEARSIHRTFHESLRFPWPRHTVQVVLKHRRPNNTFGEIWSDLIDPNSRFVNQADIHPRGTVWTLIENGPPSEKVDLVLLSAGYTEAEMDKFRADAGRLVDALFETEPFRSRRDDFNVRALGVPSAAPGINRPHVGQFRRTPVSTEYNIFDSERYMLTLDNRAFRDALSAVPYEFVEILANETQYGGGGIFNFQATTAVDTEFAEYVFVHEFGHHFAALADEYYQSPVAYEVGRKDIPEPWRPNVTALRDPSQLKWGDLVDEDVPIPTPWDKDRFDRHARETRERRQVLIDEKRPESEFDDLFREQKLAETEMLNSMEFAGRVGAFEGAMYEVTGLYRPQIDCIMFSRNDAGFCRVCSRAIEEVIDFYAAH
jgi:hypothetical protein